MQDKTVLITGANSGIGRATALALARMGACVVVHGRNRQALQETIEHIKEETGKPDVHMIAADLSSQSQIRAMASEYKSRFKKLDVLINNAGVILGDRRTTEDGLEMTFAVNHLAPFLLTNLLLDRLKESAPARVVNVSSEVHRSAKNGLDFEDLQSEKNYSAMGAYCRSKLANVLFTRRLAATVQDSQITANALHPGVVNTKVGGDGDITGVMGFLFRIAKPFMTSPEKGAATSVYLAASAEVDGISGKYFQKCKPKEPSAAALDDNSAKRLWAESSALVNGV
jgi:retinol dehydrogenase 12